MKYISLNWTLALKFSIGKKRECATAEYLWRTTVYKERYIFLYYSEADKLTDCALFGKSTKIGTEVV